MNILIIGDIFGKPGRAAIKELLPGLIEKEKVDFVIANGENASGGRGLNPKAAKELFESPIDVMTAGNHIWEMEAVYPLFDSLNILRPLNTEKKAPGRGWGVFQCKGLRIAVVCLQGEIFMDEKGRKVVNPFHLMDELLPQISLQSDIIIVDFHAEATSEKKAMAFHLDGRVHALVGTHTHIQTADEEIFTGGMAYITDLGMTGPHASVIGLRKEEALIRFLTGKKKKFKVAKGDVRLEGAILGLDESSLSVKSIKRARISLN